LVQWRFVKAKVLLRLASSMPPKGMTPASLMAGTDVPRGSDQRSSNANGQQQAESGALYEPASKKLYLEEGKMFKEVMHIMSRDHNFRAT
jgi:hypothetical protein